MCPNNIGYINDYKRKHVRRIAFEVTKAYYDATLKPAADAAGEPMNTYIKKAIEMRMKADGFKKAAE